MEVRAALCLARGLPGRSRDGANKEYYEKKERGQKESVYGIRRSIPAQSCIQQGLHLSSSYCAAPIAAPRNDLHRSLVINKLKLAIFLE